MYLGGGVGGGGEFLTVFFKTCNKSDTNFFRNNPIIIKHNLEKI